MKIQKQLNRHDPENGIYGDCHRTAIACILDMDAADVPHFMDKTTGKGEAPEANAAVEKWLNKRGLCQIITIYPGETPLKDILHAVGHNNPGICFLLSGESATGCNHSVVACDGEIVCDPSLDDSGIIGPCDDGFYWVVFFGSTRGKRYCSEHQRGWLK